MPTAQPSNHLEHSIHTSHGAHVPTYRTIECTPETHENWIFQHVEWTSTPVVPAFQHSQPSTFRNRFKEWRMFARISFLTLAETMENWVRTIDDGDRPHYMSWFNCAFTCRARVCVCVPVSVVYERMTCTIRFSHTLALWIRLNLDGEFVCACNDAVRNTKWKVASHSRTNYEQEQQHIEKKKREKCERISTDVQTDRIHTHTHTA